MGRRTVLGDVECEKTRVKGKTTQKGPTTRDDGRVFLKRGVRRVVPPTSTTTTKGTTKTSVYSEDRNPSAWGRGETDRNEEKSRVSETGTQCR